MLPPPLPTVRLLWLPAHWGLYFSYWINSHRIQSILELTLVDISVHNCLAIVLVVVLFCLSSPLSSFKIFISSFLFFKVTQQSSLAKVRKAELPVWVSIHAGILNFIFATSSDSQWQIDSCEAENDVPSKEGAATLKTVPHAIEVNIKASNLKREWQLWCLIPLDSIAPALSIKSLPKLRFSAQEE